MFEDFDPWRASWWSLTWAVGVAIGVALGGWLTVVGGAAAPGVAALDRTEDLVVLPLAAAGVTFVVHFGGQLLARMVRGRRTSGYGDSENEYAEQTEDYRIQG